MENYNLENNNMQNNNMQNQKIEGKNNSDTKTILIILAAILIPVLIVGLLIGTGIFIAIFTGENGILNHKNNSNTNSHEIIEYDVPRNSLQLH